MDLGRWGEWFCHCCNLVTKHFLTYSHTKIVQELQGSSDAKRALELIRAVLQPCLLLSPVLFSSQAPFLCCLGLQSYFHLKNNQSLTFWITENNFIA